ncbi:hypothetical protein BCY86_06450 [Pajaroellobacter abortibovis]|uniref:Uncharacterized protein n=1 Tax=Pajaroellobacter abortibovis TaxID=1882918 RepID=A0A1L6MY27_9BACT|nr:hypothetical protein BCY86_06450 [Pajaroellobacter abortibovis]
MFEPSALGKDPSPPGDVYFSSPLPPSFPPIPDLTCYSHAILFPPPPILIQGAIARQPPSPHNASPKQDLQRQKNPLQPDGFTL